MKRILHFLLPLILLGCSKVPLEEDYGSIDFAGIHWFENEGVAYLFFSISEQSSRLIRPSWDLIYRYTNANGGIENIDMEDIDITTGVHLHSFVSCGSQRICGSYSFPLSGPLDSATLRFRYSNETDIGIEKSLIVSNHEISDNFASYSALAYGVFDDINEHVRISISNNFGDLPSEDILSFGMIRRFRVDRGALTTIALADFIAERETNGGNSIVFPSSLCSSLPQLNETITFNGTEAWLQDTFPSSSPEAGFCFNVEFLDKNDNILLTNNSGLALKNPIVSTGSQILQTPLRPILQIPIVIKVCDEDSNYSVLFNQEFFSYQNYILGTSPTEDLCFSSLDDEAFNTNFRVIAEAKLNAAKLANPSGYDLAFVVLFHHDLSTEFTTKQNIIAQNLYEMADLEVGYTSPRLVGSLIYDSGANFQPNFLQQSYMIWCPQVLLSQEITDEVAFAEQNCTIAQSGELDLEIVNFVIPLGPLPSLDSYLDYVTRYGDDGLARNPQLVMYSVPVGVDTRISGLERTTFFNNGRFTIASGEKARFCTTDDVPFRFQRVSAGSNSTLYDTQNINSEWLGDNSEDEYLIGIEWSFPYWAAIAFEASVTGEIGNIIPFSQSVSGVESLGDSIWQTSQWDFGIYSQKCTSYCEHPFFDETGQYQLRSSWVSQADTTCPQSLIPNWNT